jgi:dTMP kinase
MFVTFEGGEGAGKSTTISAVAKKLSSEGKSVLCTREPGAGEFGAKIRAILLDGDEIDPKSEVLLFLADRANHITNIVKPALAQGSIVLCDRHADSTVVYQGYARGLSLEFLRAANKFSTGDLEPNLTLLLDIPPQQGLSRRVDKNRLDNESVEFHDRVRAGFLEIAKQNPNRVVVVDALQNPVQLAEQCYQEILRRC